jgi:hypothetical protein
MRCPGDDYQLLLATEFSQRDPVQLDDLDVPSANDEECGRPDVRQGRPSQIRPPAA